jgi:DDE family transposase
MSPLRWACKSTRQLARLLTAKGHPVSHMTVAQRLHGLRYSLQGNAKTKEGKQHPDRDAQFRYIQRQGKSFLSRGWPVISVDTKKKELVGNYENSGHEWQPEGQPVEVDVYDFPDLDISKAVKRAGGPTLPDHDFSGGVFSGTPTSLVVLPALQGKPKSC